MLMHCAVGWAMLCLQNEGRALPQKQQLRAASTADQGVTHLWRPAALDQVWVEYLLPPVQALHICAVVQVSCCSQGHNGQAARRVKLAQGWDEE